MMVEFPALAAFAIRLDGWTPHSLQSSRGVTVRNGRPVFFTKEKARKDAAFLISAIHAQLPPDWTPLPGPCKVEMVFALPLRRDQARSGLGEELIPDCSRVDADNLAKLCADALTKGGAWMDDGACVEWHLLKGRSAAPRTEIRVWQARIPQQGFLF